MTDNAIHIRRGAIEDSPAISRLILPLGRKFIARDFSPEGVQTLLDSFQEASILRYFQSGYRYHLAECAGRLVGVVAVRDNSHLYHLFVDETCHRRGIARSLWDIAKRESIAAGNPGRFTVNSSLFALEIYRRLGFVETGTPECRHGVVFVPTVCIVAEQVE